MAKLNRVRFTSGVGVGIVDFVEKIYFPAIERRLARSTVKGSWIPPDQGPAPQLLGLSRFLEFQVVRACLCFPQRSFTWVSQ